jgi:hypothetical protein
VRGTKERRKEVREAMKAAAPTLPAGVRLGLVHGTKVLVTKSKKASTLKATGEGVGEAQ